MSDMTRSDALARAITEARAADRASYPDHVDRHARLSVMWSTLAAALPAAEPKPASYKVSGLEPHNFRNDGSDPNQNACTYGRGVTCGYAPNALVHRRTMHFGRDVQTAGCGHNVIAMRQGDHWVHPGNMVECDDPPITEGG